MPLFVAMALAEIEAEQWDSLKEFYDVGAKLFSEVPPSFLEESSNTSTNPSTTTSPITTTSGSESGIASLTDDTESYVSVSSNEEQTTVPILQILDKVTEQQEDKADDDVDDDDDNDDDDADDLKDEEPKNIKDEDHTEAHASLPSVSASPCPDAMAEILLYQNNVSKLLDGAFSKESFMNYAKLKQGVDQFFLNRSQISRLYGAHPPPYDTYCCPDCGFEEHIFD